MKILVYGAGVIGTLYAAKLQDAANRVTVFARGDRLAEIRRNGLELENIVSGGRSTTAVNTTEALSPDDQYDVALIAVRRDQLAAVMPGLVANSRIPTLLFMLNNPIGSMQLVDALGQDRVLLGFPGAGGTRDGHVVSFALIKQQPTMLGELDGRPTERLRNIADAFRSSGFPTEISGQMDAWLKAHAFFVTAVSGAIYLAGGDCHRLSEDPDILALMTRGVREGFAAVSALNLPVTPFPLKVLFTWLPPTFAIVYWRHFFESKTADYVFGRHARNAFREMRDVASDCRIMLEKSGVKAIALEQLYRAIDDYAEQHSSILSG